MQICFAPFHTLSLTTGLPVPAIFFNPYNLFALETVFFTVGHPGTSAETKQPIHGQKRGGVNTDTKFYLFLITYN